MKISIASDHAGYNSKQSIIKFLEQKKIKVLDLGTNSIDSVDYPEYGQKVAKSVISKKNR